MDKRYTVHLYDNTKISNCYIFKYASESFRLRLSEIGVIELMKSTADYVILNNKIFSDDDLQLTVDDKVIKLSDIHCILLGTRIIYLGSQNIVYKD